ncbi:MAG: AtpZ/AtpI family protein [Lachnospiraceae bacterium]|nr:AtpZ/AtpI family protein [Lachnospiraceae bacterium]
MKNKLKVVEALSMVVQIGLNMLVSIFLCLAVGLYIDKHFGTSLTIFFLVFGIISGYCGAYSTFKTLIERSTKDADALYAELDISEDDGFEDDEAEAVGDEQRP